MTAMFISTMFHIFSFDFQFLRSLLSISLRFSLEGIGINQKKHGGGSYLF